MEEQEITALWDRLLTLPEHNQMLVCSGLWGTMRAWSSPYGPKIHDIHNCYWEAAERLIIKQEKRVKSEADNLNKYKKLDNKILVAKVIESRT